MTRDEWAKFDGRVVVVDDHVCGGMIGRYRHSDGVLDPHSVRGDRTQAGAVPCSVIYGPWSARLWRPEVGETVIVRDAAATFAGRVDLVYEGSRVCFEEAQLPSALLRYVEPAWFPEPEAATPEQTKPSPPPIEAPEGWELVGSIASKTKAVRTIRKGDSVREERLELCDGEWRMVVSDPVSKVIRPDAPTRGRLVFADSLELLRQAAVGVGLPVEAVSWTWVQPPTWIDPAKDANSTTIRIDIPMLADKDYVRREILPSFDRERVRFERSVFRDMLVDGEWMPKVGASEEADDQAKVDLGNFCYADPYKPEPTTDPPPFPRPLVQTSEQVEQRTQAEAGFRSALRRWRVVHGLVPEERVSWWVRLWRWVRGR